MTTKDILIEVTSNETKSERRVNIEWTLLHLKKRLELITGIPPESQQLLFYASPVTVNPIPIDINRESETLQNIGLVAQCRIHVNDTRPVSEQLNLGDIDHVDKYEMPKQEYEKLDNSVLAWKKTNQLGRFNPNSDKIASEIEKASYEQIQVKGIEVGKRCMANGRRGTVRYVGLVAEIPTKSGINRPWIGIEFDEPVGKNDGSIKNKRYFEVKENHGSFISPEFVEIGDFDEEDYMDEL